MTIKLINSAMTSSPFALSGEGFYCISSNSSNPISEFMYRPELLIYPKTSYSRTTTIPSSDKSLSVQQIIISFRDEGLPLSAIAEIARVGRKTIYSWLAGGAIRPENQKRLETLHDLLFTHKNASFLYLYRYWNQKNNKKLCLGSLLKKKKLDLSIIRELLIEIWSKANMYQTNLRQSYLEANEDEGQREINEEWKNTLADGNNEW